MFTINTEAGEVVCVLHLKIPNLILTSPEQFARENQQRVQSYREQAEQGAYYWRAHPQEKHQQINTLLSVALALFVGNQIGKD
jgi:hypothetical protein